MTFSIRWESNGKRNHPYYGKSMTTNIPISLPYHVFSLGFLVLWEIEGKTHVFPYDEVDPTVKITHTMERVWKLISQVFPIWEVSLHFPYMTNRWENTCISHMTFSHMNIPYIIPEDGNLMEIKPILCKLYVN